MTYLIEIAVEMTPPFADVQAIETAVRATLLQQQVPGGELTVVLADNKRLHELNKQFLGIDKPTDVLSFPAGDDEPWPQAAGGSPPYLGDIAIAVPYAAAQAEKAGHPLLAELQLLAVHGTLHLLGFDHGSSAEKAEMWAAQQAVLDQLGLAGVAPSET